MGGAASQAASSDAVSAPRPGTMLFFGDAAAAVLSDPIGPSRWSRADRGGARQSLFSSNTLSWDGRHTIFAIIGSSNSRFRLSSWESMPLMTLFGRSVGPLGINPSLSR